MATFKKQEISAPFKIYISKIIYKIIGTYIFYSIVFVTFIYVVSERKKERKKVKSLSRVQLLATPWNVAYQAPLSMGFSRQ